jgi:beta-lactamase class A
MLQRILDSISDVKLLQADGFNDAVIGIDLSSMRLVYSVNKCTDILITRDGMTQEEAIEYLEFNTFSAYVGEKTPIWVHDNF